MAEQKFLNSLGDLTGKVAIVTGGSQGIGLQTTILLARLGAKVYVSALDDQKNRDGVALAQEALKRDTTRSNGAVYFHELDLSSIVSAARSAEVFKKKTDEAGNAIGRLDIIIGNAGIAFPPLNALSPDGYERTFAVNCLGHYVFITSLLDLVEQTATLRGEARITLTSSYGYKAAKKLNYTSLTTKVPKDGKSLLDLGGGFQRYLDSKLAVLYFALELSKQLSKRDLDGVFVNACHPGNVPKTDIGKNQQPLVSPVLATAIKSFLGLFLRNSAQDAAKTQVFLSASKQVREKNAHGEYWVPMWSWRGKYIRSQKEELSTALAKDEEEWKLLWEFCANAVAKALKGN